MKFDWPRSSQDRAGRLGERDHSPPDWAVVKGSLEYAKCSGLANRLAVTAGWLGLWVLTFKVGLTVVVRTPM